MQPVRSPSRVGVKRRGLTTPAIVMALLTAMIGLAFVLDRIWLETAQLELTTAAEATALAAARQLASDDRLISGSDSTERLNAAHIAADMASGLNRVAGQLPDFRDSSTDILFGNYELQSNGRILFDTSVDDPHHVRITLHRSRARNNPVALFIGQMTGIPFGDVVRQADAGINFQIAAIRPVTGATAPVLPLAICKSDPSGSGLDSWDVQIEQRKGSDNYRIDPNTQLPVRGSDGLPELTLRSLVRGGRPELCNMQVLDFQTNFDDDQLARQFASGLNADDLAEFGGQLNLPINMTCTGSPDLLSRDRDALESILGQPRICLLFSTAAPISQKSFVTTTCVDLVAVRVMSVQDQSDGSCAVIVQPTVIATRSALVAAALNLPTNATPNKYIANLRVTN